MKNPGTRPGIQCGTRASDQSAVAIQFVAKRGGLRVIPPGQATHDPRFFSLLNLGLHAAVDFERRNPRAPVKCAICF